MRHVNKNHFVEKLLEKRIERDGFYYTKKKLRLEQIIGIIGTFFMAICIPLFLYFVFSKINSF
ncbi:hypothetical protein [Calditerrivibrio nitroreducens]|uniref:CCAAT-box DNA binding protein subunit B n=1 Tax=Calditerrivibrio nitroreducens (strain DSM 19672 / NBRC 101217 / Yu37-1) TaxID=768670 RepID=E4TKC1_CALNY|nr:hypothetical protein [Calditerrivibrio nitroreducens]ADR19993.1 CCAAT-box DNA binding protein subunit B [Calditerrivibrio nitroreducens DSM 19672]